jgi:hypothetical protein
VNLISGKMVKLELFGNIESTIFGLGCLFIFVVCDK